jgi:hypothetical protein
MKRSSTPSQVPSLLSIAVFEEGSHPVEADLSGSTNLRTPKLKPASDTNVPLLPPSPPIFNFYVDFIYPVMQQQKKRAVPGHV